MINYVKTTGLIKKYLSLHDSEQLFAKGESFLRSEHPVVYFLGEQKPDNNNGTQKNVLVKIECL